MDSTEMLALADEIEQSEGLIRMKRPGESVPVQLGIKKTAQVIASLRASAAPSDGGRNEAAIIEPIESAGLMGAKKQAIAEHASMLPTIDPLADLVSRFSRRLLAKLRLAQANGRNGWERNDWEADCQRGLLRHIEKGDPRDVAAYCAFMDHHGWITKSAALPPDAGKAEPVREQVVWLREVDAGTDNACWVISNRVDRDAVPFFSGSCAHSSAQSKDAAK